MKTDKAHRDIGDFEPRPLNHITEFQEIIGRTPSWISRWGSVFTLLLILVGICFSYFIKYPQTISSQISLTTSDPPADLPARYSGLIDSVYVNNGSWVSKGQLIAIIESPADYKDVQFIESFIKGCSCLLDNPPQVTRVLEMTLNLGDLSTVWEEFISVYRSYADFLLIDPLNKKRNVLSKQIRNAEIYSEQLKVQHQLLIEEFEFEKEAIKRDSTLLAQNAIAQEEYENTASSFISMRRTIVGSEASITSAQLSELQLEQQLIEVETQMFTEYSEYGRQLEKLRSTLLNEIALWRERYAIVAPIDGFVSLHNVWTKAQLVIEGDIIASISPSCAPRIIGRLKVSSVGFGKVQQGQDVIVKLNGFPYLEYGAITGKVEQVSLVPERIQGDISYNITVSFPDGLNSTYSKLIPFVQGMDGTAEIVVEDMRLLDHLLLPIKTIYKSGM